MARRQMSSRWNRFLDLIGLVDNDREAESESKKTTQSRRTSQADNDDYLNDDSDDTPRPQRNSAETGVRRQRPRVNLGDDGFPDEDVWGNASSDARTRPAQRTGSRSRSTAGVTAEDFVRRRSSSSSAARSGGEPASRRRSASYYDDDYPAPEPSRQTHQARHQTVIYTLKSIDECKEVILSLIDKKTVLLNLDELDTKQLQRALDTMGGATYAIGATMSTVSSRTYLITPSDVEVEHS